MEVATKWSLTWLLLWAVGLIVLPGCYKDSVGGRRTAAAVVADPPSKAGRENIAILMPDHPQAHQIRGTLVNELSYDFNLVTIAVDDKTTVNDLGAELSAVQPTCVVVMENRTVRLYQRLQQASPEQRFAPAVILMTSFLDQVIGSLKEATGIAYEVPAVTGFVAARGIVTKRLDRIGVVHRQSFSGLVSAQTELAALEKLEIIGAQVPDHPSLHEIDDAVFALIHDHEVDALWVLNDNALLTRDALGQIWLPRLQDKSVPVVVGVSTLVQPQVGFGTLAMLPDHESLGSQAANMIFDLADDNWHVSERPVEQPLSVRTVVNVRQLRGQFGLQPDALLKVDQALE